MTMILPKSAIATAVLGISEYAEVPILTLWILRSSGIGDDNKGKLRSKMNTSFDGQISERPFRDEGRSSGLRHSTKEKRATTLLQPGTLFRPMRYSFIANS